MILACFMMILIGAAVALPLTALLARLGHRLGTFDSAGVPGQIKPPPRRIPNTGGIAVFCGVTVPMAVGLLVVHAAWGVDAAGQVTATGLGSWLESVFPGVAPHVPGILLRGPEAVVLMAALAVVHGMGLVDDRRPMRAIPKLVIMIGVTSALAVLTGSRLLTALDGLAGGAWLSYAVTVLWLIVVMNAMNFLDNMDGLSGGIGLIASAFFLAATLTTEHPQWFIAASLSLLIGSLAGFLWFNAPRPWSQRGARIFLGDGGSLVVGLLLGFLTVRTTYIDHAATADALRPSPWYSVFMPVIVLAIPLYDFTTVVTLRVRQGKSPLVGDLQHVSHRLVQRGLSRRGAVYVLWALTAATGCGAVALRSLQDWQALLVAAQTLMILGVLFAIEHASRHAATALSQHRNAAPESAAGDHAPRSSTAENPPARSAEPS